MRMPALLLLPLLFPLSCVAAASEEKIDCNDASSTVEMNFCAQKDFDAADAQLNAVYQKVLAHIGESDLEKPYDRASWEEAMRASQRAWVAFRDADCKGAVPMEWSGGTGTTVAVVGCMTTLTEARTKDLASRYDVALPASSPRPQP
ncbi:MAG TPA: DUF1311 domain-containing protein [Hyphomicrobium zavarzinii]|jgi:uncharacterized protein YecT (DUF1311 family)|uniref:lysozyme inhibitor LprI family protein n=1 Tax=Hyphomicrobium sp. DMF-1 TaxID=3019544 RepID=UPI0022EC0137|nr:lysozyme inhibitor LprI family protein [Hyphomicrobium sp. DMF-1]WBT36620.1 DUF1311 domain-containing protein [Hyphomicrobium sp. DMF-1]HML43701.1 DUF1311 domain-containing protein [Hyphomicrobium zavarzinii]